MYPHKTQITAAYLKLALLVTQEIVCKCNFVEHINLMMQMSIFDAFYLFLDLNFNITSIYNTENLYL